jgi:UDPglucose 6-dehydrogenase
VTGACFAEFGLKVICVDKDAAKIEMLRNGKIPIYEPGLEELVKKNVAEGRLEFTTHLADAIKRSLVLFIAVGTPPRGDGSVDMSYVEAVAEEVAQSLNEYKVIVTKSTVPVGTGQRLREIITQRLKTKVDFDVVSNPEFLREGSAINDFMRPDRVVIGADSPHAVAILKDLYRPLYLIETPFVVTNVATAELIKYASNAFLATKISFINELSILCEKVGGDVNVLAKGLGLDGRIGPKFLHAGPGYGGSCFPKDTSALLQIAKSRGIDLYVVDAAIRANQRQQSWMAEKIARILGGTLRGRTLGVLGLSFKPNTNDIRDSPAINIARALLKEGAKLRAYDPAALEEARTLLPEMTPCADAYETVKGADALLLMTEWNQFRNLDLDRIKQAMAAPVFVDLRNVYDPERMKELGFRYIGVGRGTSSD